MDIILEKYPTAFVKKAVRLNRYQKKCFDNTISSLTKQEDVQMEFSTYALVIFGVLSAVNVVCTIILYPELKQMIKDIKED